MRDLVRLLSAAMFAAALSAAPAFAQDLQLLQPRGRMGYYFSLNLGGGYREFWVDGHEHAKGGTGVMTLAFGQMVTEHFGLGLRIGANLGSQLALIGLEGQWEFVPNLALRAGLGLGVASVEKDKSDPDAKQKGTVGGGYSLGLSYDWFLLESRTSGGLALTPLIEARVVPGNDVSAVTGFIGLGITYWTGLPRRELVLPDKEAYRRHR